tara:strand:+ start:289 stop:975 length:687 start_codon:yes stop_codon:yes gene_type:complete
MNKKFVNEFKATKKLMKKSLYKDEEWVKEVISKLDSLEKIWPTNMSHRKIAESINETLFDVDVIFDFTFLDREKVKFELSSHGSMHFYFLSQYLPPGEIEEYIENLSEAKEKSFGSNYIISKLAESINKNISRKPKKLTAEDKAKYLLDNLDYSIWSFIAADCKIWSAEEEFTQIVTKHSEKKSNFSRKDAAVVHEILLSFAKKGYLKEADEPKAKVQLYADLQDLLV